ncbi:hypothetical protein F53441_6578 [Fusarium austroafricanum]|uniref:Uncharacterized protein n=1 Tax=Fusarium austroafricanum TaxID=2364996 RepID=A0A8H4KFE1_9HYPO|nr:hypothetical protein F53441_6578 [Fusarium austroafricanum]
MLVRDSRKLVLFVVPVFLLIVFALKLYLDPAAFPAGVKDWVPSQLKKSSGDDQELLADEEPPPAQSPTPQPTTAAKTDVSEDKPFGNGIIPQDISTTHNEVFSVSTKDKKFFEIDFKDFHALNANIIPHPTLDNTWVVVAQWSQDGGNSLWFAEVVCNAAFQDDVLRCINAPTTLPVTATVGGDKCEGDMAYFHMNMGPHDARVFFGPEKPYTTYGSNSMFTCFGQFVQDFRTLTNWRGDMSNLSEFRVGTELQRPLPWNLVEKNWFLFWDSNGIMYTHYDITPKRTFAQMNPDGSAGPDLAPAAVGDEQCLAKYLPKLTTNLESIHQSTNSLKITMCRRDEPGCVPDDSNTFIMVIFQHKSYFNYHSVYEPYVMLFKQQAPFEIHAMSKKPIWIHGRKKYPEKETSDMFYVTSMSWKSREQKYHGFIGDDMFLGFGIEDVRTAGIDVRAEDILKDMGICFEG